LIKLLVPGCSVNDLYSYHYTLSEKSSNVNKEEV